MKILIRGGGDLGSGVAFRLHRVGWNVVITEMIANRGKVIRVTLDDRSSSARACAIPGDPVAVAFRVLGGIDEETFFDRGEVSARLKDLLEECHRAFFKVTHHLTQRTFFIEFEQLFDTVQGSPGLFDRLHTADVVVMPGDVASFIRRDRALYIRAGEHGDQRVDRVRADRFFNVGFDVAGVLLCAHLEIRKEIAQGYRVGQVIP